MLRAILIAFLSLSSCPWLLAEDGASPSAATATPETNATNPAESTSAAAPSDPIRVLTRRGEIIVGALELTEVTIRTSYGVLRVPLEDVLVVDLALSGDGEGEDRVRDTVARYLSVPEGDLRATLRSELIEIVSALPDAASAVRDAAEGEPRKALDDVLQSIGEGAGRRIPKKDVVATRRFTIQGEVDLSSLAIRSPYGELLLPRSDIARVVLRDGALNALSDKVLIIKTWGDPNGEYLNTLNIIKERAKVRPIEFTGTTAADLTKALRKVGVVVIPELEQGGNCAEVAQQASAAIKRFVRDGGVIVSCGGYNNISFLGATGLFQCSRANGSAGSVVKKHPIVKGVSGTIPNANATIPINVHGGKMKTLAGQDGAILVGVATIGSGAVVYCGWDYYVSEEAHQRVLGNAVDWARSRQTGGLFATP